MATLAFHFKVRAGQAVARLRMIEVLAYRRLFPVVGVVTLLAVRAQASLVFVLMASDAGLRKP